MNRKEVVKIEYLDPLIRRAGPGLHPYMMLVDFDPYGRIARLVIVPLGQYQPVTTMALEIKKANPNQAIIISNLPKIVFDQEEKGLNEKFKQAFEFFNDPDLGAPEFWRVEITFNTPQPTPLGRGPNCDRYMYLLKELRGAYSEHKQGSLEWKKTVRSIFQQMINFDPEISSCLVKLSKEISKGDETWKSMTELSLGASKARKILRDLIPQFFIPGGIGSAKTVISLKELMQYWAIVGEEVRKDPAYKTSWRTAYYTHENYEENYEKIKSSIDKFIEKGGLFISNIPI